MKNVYIIGVLLSLFGWQNAQASPVTFTGADLLNLPAVSFPNGWPPLDADTGIVFNRPPNSAILASIALDGLIGRTNSLTVDLNVNRRSGDFDLALAITDGVRGVGAIIADNLGGQLIASPNILLLTEQEVDRGSFGVSRNGVGNPGVDSDFDVSYDFIVSDAGVDVSFGFLGQSLSFFSPVALNRASGLSLILISDINASISEVYEINSLTLQNTQVSEPQYLAFFAFSLLGFLVYRRRHL